MAENRPVWGIDIGQYALKAIRLQYSESSERAVATAFDYVQFPKILSQPDAIPEELIPQALETFLSRNDVQGDLISISVPGHAALVRFIQLPPVESSKIGEIIKYEARQQIPFALDEVIWDYQPLGAGVQESGYMLDAEVGLFAMKRDQIMKALRPFNNAKLEVELIQIAPLALYNVLAYDELGILPGEESPGRDEHVIVLDMGCDNTTLVVSNGAKIWVRNVPIGGNHFTRALTKEMKLSFAKAEHLKCNATKSPDPRAVFQALRPVFNDYVSEIQRSIGFFSSVNRQAKISKVIGFGNGFKLAGLQKFLQQNLQYNVERPDNFKQLSGDAVLNAPLFQENLLGFAVPYGLALQTVGLSRIQTSLLPPEIATAREVRRKKPWAVVSAAALLSGLTLSMIGTGITYSAVHTEPWDEAVKEAEAINKQVNDWKSAYDAEKGKFTATLDEAARLVEGRRNMLWPEVYKAINECLPREEGEEKDTTDIQLRNRISINSITNVHLADVKQWFDTLSEVQKESMSEYDKEHPPSGDGYIFILEGSHYHHEEDEPEMQELSYVKNVFLKSETGLQNWTVPTEDGTQQDVGRLGISHARVELVHKYDIEYNPRGPEATLAAREGEQRLNMFNRGFALQQGRRGGASVTRPGGLGIGGFGTDAEEDYASRGPVGRSGGFAGGGRFGQRPGTIPVRGTVPFEEPDPNIQYIKKTEFTVQFVWKPTPPQDRVDDPPYAASQSGDAGAPAGDKAAN